MCKTRSTPRPNSRSTFEGSPAFAGIGGVDSMQRETFAADQQSQVTGPGVVVEEAFPAYSRQASRFVEEAEEWAGLQPETSENPTGMPTSGVKKGPCEDT